MERKDRLFLVVFDVYVFDVGVVFFVDVFEYVCWFFGVVDQFLEFCWNCVGEVGGCVIRVVVEFVVFGVGIVFFDHGFVFCVGDLVGVCCYWNVVCVVEEVLYIIGEDVVDEFGGQIFVV